MPKSKETISSSEGSESGTASSEEEKQKSKLKKQDKKEKSSASESESEEEAKSKKRSKKPSKEDKGGNKKAKTDKKAKDDEEETTWELGGNKQVNIRNFKGKWFVDIREMYMDKEGEMKPGRKGICMNMENWKAFMKVVEEVDKSVKAMC